MKKPILILLLCLLVFTIYAQDRIPVILPLKERAEVIDRLFEEKIKIVLPEIMDREGIDMWLIMAREYNEDPVIRTMLPATWHAGLQKGLGQRKTTGSVGSIS